MCTICLHKLCIISASMEKYDEGNTIEFGPSKIILSLSQLHDMSEKSLVNIKGNVIDKSNSCLVSNYNLSPLCNSSIIGYLEQ